MNPAVSALRSILNPRSVAVIGASGDPAKFGAQLDAALVWARQLADNAPLVLSVLRDYVGRIIPKGPSELAAQGRATIQRIRQSADAKEGIASFKEKRKARFSKK